MSSTAGGHVVRRVARTAWPKKQRRRAEQADRAHRAGGASWHLLSTPPLHTSFQDLLSTPPLHTSSPHLLSTPPLNTSLSRSHLHISSQDLLSRSHLEIYPADPHTISLVRWMCLPNRRPTHSSRRWGTPRPHATPIRRALGSASASRSASRAASLSGGGSSREQAAP
jgi:hypothetical protein